MQRKKVLKYRESDVKMKAPRNLSDPYSGLLNSCGDSEPAF